MPVLGNEGDVLEGVSLASTAPLALGSKDPSGDAIYFKVDAQGRLEIVSTSTQNYEDDAVVVPGGPHTTLNFAGSDFTVVDAGSGQADVTIDDSGIDHDATTNFVANEHIDHTGVNLTAGAGLTGGGDISANRTFDVGSGTGITVNANDVALDTANTRNTDHAAVTLTAGTGLTGGGNITLSRTFNVIGANSIVANANDIQLVNDVGAPGANQVYGTNGAGTKGWKADPAGGGGSTNNPSPITDNAVVRGDGGASNVQDSGVIIDDADIMTGVTCLEIVGGGATHRLMVQNTTDSGELIECLNDVGTPIFTVQQDSPGSGFLRVFNSAGVESFVVENGEVSLPKKLYANSAGESSTTSTTYQEKLTASFTPSEAGDTWIVYYYAEVRNGSDEQSCQVRCHLNNATVLGEARYFSETGALDDFETFSGFIQLTGVAAAAQQVDIDWRVGTGDTGTAFIRRARIMVERAS